MTCLCSICGDPIVLHDEDDPDDAVCPHCYLVNLKGGFPLLRPTVAPLVPRPGGRLTLATLNRQRWPLTHGD